MNSEPKADDDNQYEISLLVLLQDQANFHGLTSLMSQNISGMLRRARAIES